MNTDDDETVTREELLQWLDSEIAAVTLLVNDELPGGQGLEYVQQKTREYSELINQGYRGLVLRLV
jgi:hypothetical protein